MSSPHAATSRQAPDPAPAANGQAPRKEANIHAHDIAASAAGDVSRKSLSAGRRQHGNVGSQDSSACLVVYVHVRV